MRYTVESTLRRLKRLTPRQNVRDVSGDSAEFQAWRVCKRQKNEGGSRCRRATNQNRGECRGKSMETGAGRVMLLAIILLSVRSPRGGTPLHIPLESAADVPSARAETETALNGIACRDCNHLDAPRRVRGVTN